MKLGLPTGTGGKVSTTITNAIVATAFLAVCVVIGLQYLQKGDKPRVNVNARRTAKPAVSAKPSREYLDVQFYSSSAKRRWIDEMVKAFNRGGHKVGGKTARVKAHHVTSGGSYDALKEGRIKPDLWSPGDESWLRMAAAYWKNIKQKDLFTDYRPLVNIPLVIAMWEPMAKALGYPNPIGWKDLAKVASQPHGWTAFGHPEWGGFRWGHAHPDANSGFLSIISILYAGLGKTDGITPDDLKKPDVVSFLANFEGAVEHYGLSNSWIDDMMHRKGPAYLSAAVQYENTIIQTNERHKNKPFKLVAIYPEEGAFRTRHPVAVIEESWMTPEKKKACAAFVDFLLSGGAQRRAMELGLRPISPEIRIGSPFDEAHGVREKIAGEKRFKVPEEAVLKRIRDLWEQVKTPATVALLIDRSGSMKGEPMEKAKEGAVLFIQHMKPRDQLEVVAFSNREQVITPLCSIRECGEDAVSRVEGLFAAGGTALYDTVKNAYQRLKELRKKDPKRRYGLVVLSDGKDTRSDIQRYDFLDTLPKGEDFDVPKIFTIAYGRKADKALLKQMSNRTNARMFSSSADKIVRTYKELSANF